MCPANERRCIVTLSLIGWMHTKMTPENVCSMPILLAYISNYIAKAMFKPSAQKHKVHCDLLVSQHIPKWDQMEVQVKLQKRIKWSVDWIYGFFRISWPSGNTKLTN